VSTDPDPTDLSNHLVEQVARSIHDAYLEDHEAAGGDPHHEAAAPWDDLPPHLRAQNLRQVRTNLRRASQLGFRLVPLADAGPDRVLELTADQVEVLARIEHDDWSRQKRSQGYRWGEERVVEGPAKTHPDLLAWEDLGEPAREKDRSPMRRLIAQLERAGLAIVPD
jgi:hypothetical protein